MTLTDDQLTRALGAAADAIEVPDWEGLPESPAKPVWWQRRPVQAAGLAAAAASVAILIGSFAGNPERSGTRFADGPAKAAPSSAVGGSTTGGTTGSGNEVAGAPPVFTAAQGVRPAGTQYSAPLGSVGAGRQPAAAPEAPAAAPVGASADARVVKTGSISLVVDDGKVPATMIKLRQVAASVRGFLSEEKTQGVGSDPSGVATMRVPVASFDAVVATISGKGFGAKVTGVESSGKDVSAEYADTEAQIKSLKAAHDRYLTILNGADTIGEILSVQQRVDDVQKQIDRLEGSRRLLANQSDLATLTVSVNQKAAQVLVRSERSGWSKAWHDAGHGFTSGIQSILAHSGRVLLVLLVAVACIALGRGGWRVARRRLI